MSKFLKIPISPLMGSSLINYIKVILSNNIPLTKIWDLENQILKGDS